LSLAYQSSLVGVRGRLRRPRISFSAAARGEVAGRSRSTAHIRKQYNHLQASQSYVDTKNIVSAPMIYRDRKIKLHSSFDAPKHG
jgi:hypothetical protein